MVVTMVVAGNACSPRLDYGPAACRQVAGYMVSMVRLRFDKLVGLGWIGFRPTLDEPLSDCLGGSGGDTLTRLAQPLGSRPVRGSG